MHTWKNEQPSIETSVVINSKLKVRVYHSEVIQSNVDLDDIVDKHYNITSYSQINHILTKFSKIENFTAYLQTAVKFLDRAKTISENYNVFQYTNQLNFILDQLNLMCLTKKRYTLNHLLVAFGIFMYSPTSYGVIRDHGFVILPHQQTIHKIKSCQNIGANSDESNEIYFQNIISKLQPKEKLIRIQIDENYCKVKSEYKAKNLVGYADNSPNMAKTILTFMINSIFGSMKEVVKLVPVHNLNGKQQFDYTQWLSYISCKN